MVNGIIYGLDIKELIINQERLKDLFHLIVN